MAGRDDQNQDANAPEPAPDDEIPVDSWPSLSGLDLDVCVMDSALPGTPPPDERPGEP